MDKQEHFKRRTRGFGQDRRGRSRKKERFVKLDFWLLKMPAWRALGPVARAVYIELAQRYNGSNNGEISMSVREVARFVHVAKDTASKAFYELEEKGFIRRHVCGSFNWKLRHATTWVLTEFPIGEIPGTKDFARWTETKSKAGPALGTDCPKPGTTARQFLQILSSSVGGLGPWARFCTVDRSQFVARI